MEDLIATNPNDFFPRHQLTLQGRQGTFQELGRYDLLFVDEFGTQILMELKAIPAKYEHATQLARYRDALRQKTDTNVLMWLVSPSIPRSVRDFLDQIGIEYTEIHEAEFRKVAACRGYSFVGVDVISQADSSPASAKTLSTVSRTRNEQRNQGAVSWFFNTDEGEPEGVGAYVRMLENSCIALWEYPDTEKKLSKPKPGERVFFYLNGVGIIATGIFTIEPPISSNLIFRKQTQQEFIRRVSDLLSVANDSAITVSEVAQMGYVLPCVSSLCRISNEQVADKMLRELESRNGVRC
jgi:hypothetical protein